MSQEDLAALLSLERTTISKYEQKKSYPTIDVVSRIVKIFNISIDDLCYKDLDYGQSSAADTSHTTSADPHASYYKKNKNYLIPVAGRPDYLGMDADAKVNFKEVIIPGVYGEARTFEVFGDSMAPLIHSGDYVGCTRQQIEHLVDNAIYVVVSKPHGIILARVAKEQENLLRLSVENQAAGNPYTIAYEEVEELWKVQVRITGNLSTF